MQVFGIEARRCTEIASTPSTFKKLIKCSKAQLF